MTSVLLKRTKRQSCIYTPKHAEAAGRPPGAEEGHGAERSPSWERNQSHQHLALGPRSRAVGQYGSMLSHLVYGTCFGSSSYRPQRQRSVPKLHTTTVRCVVNMVNTYELGRLYPVQHLRAKTPLGIKALATTKMQTPPSRQQ